MHDIARAAADAARVPDFDSLVARGHRRRHVRNGLTVGAAGLALAGILGATQLLGGSGGEDVQPAPSPSPSPSTSRSPAPEPSAQDEPRANELTVDHPDAVLADAAVLPGGGIATVWSVDDLTGVHTSPDGFAATESTRNYPIPQEVFAAGDRFVVRDEALTEAWVLEPGGDRHRVEVTGPEAPVGDGELALGMGEGIVAVDPSTGTAHPVPSPELMFDVDAYGGRLSATSTSVTGGEVVEVTYHWSDDGGASWQSAVFETTWNSSVETVPTAAGTDHVLLLRGGRATIEPLVAVLAMPPGGGGFTATAYDGEQAYSSGAWVFDGEIYLLADLSGSGRGPIRESGLYRWADGGLERVTTRSPEVTDAEGRRLVEAVVTDGPPDLLVAVGAELYRSTDGGTRWDALAAR